MSRYPDRRESDLPEAQEPGLPEKQGDPMGEPPPPFDTESRLEHTDADAEPMERLKRERGVEDNPRPSPAGEPGPGITHSGKYGPEAPTEQDEELGTTHGTTRGEEPLSGQDPEPGPREGRGDRPSARRDDDDGV